MDRDRYIEELRALQRKANSPHVQRQLGKLIRSALNDGNEVWPPFRPWLRDVNKPWPLVDGETVPNEGWDDADRRAQAIEDDYDERADERMITDDEED